MRATGFARDLLPSNVRIKRARRSPEILILHHVCDRWSRVDHRYWRVYASLPTFAAVAAVWVVPLRWMPYICVSNLQLEALPGILAGLRPIQGCESVYEGFAPDRRNSLDAALLVGGPSSILEFATAAKQECGALGASIQTGSTASTNL